MDRDGVAKLWGLDGTPVESNEATTNFDVVSASFSVDGQVVAATLADGSVAVGNIAGGGWREWLVNEPLFRAFSASLDEGGEIVESASRRQDSYSFEGRIGQEIVISMTSDDFEPYFILQNAAGETIADGYSSLRTVLSANGTYRFLATHTGGEAAIGVYSFQVNERRYIEPPILQETAASLEEGDEIISDKLRDVYQIEGEAGQEITISMESEEFDTYLELENAIGENIAQDDDGGDGRNSSLSMVLPEAGTYKIIATTFGEGQSGSYSLQANKTQLARPPILQETATRLEEGDEVIQTLIRRGDVYSFEGEEGQEIAIIMDSEDFSTSLELQNAEGETIEQARSLLGVVLPETGTYKVVATSSGEGSGIYSLVVNPTPLKSISVSPDGQRLAIALSDGTIQLWDLQDNSIVTSSQSHQGEVLAVAFSSDGQRIVSGGSDRTVRLWDLEGNPTGEPFQGHNGEVLSVAFSSDNQRIVSGGQDGTLRLWDLEGNSIGEPFRGHGSEVLSVAFSPDNQNIVSSSGDNTIRLWEANVSVLLRGHEDEVFGVAFSPDGQRIVSSSADGTIRLWDLQGNQIAPPFQGHEGEVYLVAFSPDGQRIVSGGEDETIRLWDLQGNQIGQPFLGHEDIVYGVVFSPDGQRIVSGGEDETIRLWDLQGNQIAPPFQGHEGAVYLVAFSPDGQRIVSSGLDGTIRLWDLQGNQIGQPFLGHEGWSSGITFSPDAQRIVSGGEDRTIRLWDLRGNQIGPPLQGHEDSVNLVAFSPDGQRIVSGSQDRTIRLWDLQGNQIGPPLQGHEGGVFGVVFSPDGRQIASSSWDGTVKLWWASWEEWLQNSCNRLHHHPILRNPDESRGEEFLTIAAEVGAACDQRIWEQY